MNISIVDFSTRYNVGHANEDNVTTIDVTIPQELLDLNADHYMMHFLTSGFKSRSTGNLTAVEGIISTPLWDDIMDAGPLKMRIGAYDMDGLELVKRGYSDVVTLIVDPGIPDGIEGDTAAQGLLAELQTALATVDGATQNAETATGNAEIATSNAVAAKTSALNAAAAANQAAETATPIIVDTPAEMPLNPADGASCIVSKYKYTTDGGSPVIGDVNKPLYLNLFPDLTGHGNGGAEIAVDNNGNIEYYLFSVVENSTELLSANVQSLIIMVNTENYTGDGYAWVSETTAFGEIVFTKNWNKLTSVNGDVISAVPISETLVPSFTILDVSYVINIDGYISDMPFYWLPKKYYALDGEWKSDEITKARLSIIEPIRDDTYLRAICMGINTQLMNMVQAGLLTSPTWIDTAKMTLCGIMQEAITAHRLPSGTPNTKEGVEAALKIILAEIISDNMSDYEIYFGDSLYDDVSHKWSGRITVISTISSYSFTESALRSDYTLLWRS